MNISKIVIDNIKGLGHFEFNQSLYPNRPNVLVAPNGFGKSSFATAFLSLSGGIIKLKPEELYMGRPDKSPRVELKFTDGNTFTADSITNSIVKEFSVHVVNNQLIPTATAKHFGRVITSSASLDIKPTTIIRKIPKKAVFNYRLPDLKRDFGINNKVLIDISGLFSKAVNIESIERDLDMHQFELKKYYSAIDGVLQIINELPITTSASNIKKIVLDADYFNIGVPEYAELCRRIKNVLKLGDDIDAFLSGWQYIKVRKAMGNSFKIALEYLKYIERRNVVDQTLEHLNPVKSRFCIKTSEQKGALLVTWPKANQISNGERDIMVFVAKLLECEYQSQKNCILVIDEFFDYLDDANLIAFQYYVSTLIDSFRRNKRIIFPILLTHLDPNYLKHFCFNDKRLNVCYLKETKARISKEMVNVVKNREDELLKTNLDMYYFHYNPNGDSIDITSDFVEKGLNKSWGKPDAFRKKIEREIRTYCLEDNPFDPLAVCFAVRMQIEKLVYNKLDPSKQAGFLSEHGTSEKLMFAQSSGVSIPETYFLLGIIYNHPLHDCNEDMSKPLGMKLDNPIIKKMIQGLWEN